MKPAPFEYHRPASIDEALALLAQHGGDAKPLAGGQSLIPAMNFRLATPSVLVDLNAIPALQFMRETETGLKVGVGSSRVDLQACKLEYSIVSPK